MRVWGIHDALYQLRAGSRMRPGVCFPSQERPGSGDQHAAPSSARTEVHLQAFRAFPGEEDFGGLRNAQPSLIFIYFLTAFASKLETAAFAPNPFGPFAGRGWTLCGSSALSFSEAPDDRMRASPGPRARVLEIGIGVLKWWVCF